MNKVIISKGYICYLCTLELGQLEFLFLFFEKLAPYEFVTNISVADLFKLQNDFPHLRKLTTPVVNYRFVSNLLDTEKDLVDLIENKIYAPKFFLLDIDSDTARAFRNKFNLFFSGKSDFEKDFNEFFTFPINKWEINEMSFGFSIGKKPMFTEWIDIVDRVYPSVFYFISDRYCLKQENDESIDINIAKLISNLIEQASTDIVPLVVINTSDEKGVSKVDLEYLKNLIIQYTNRKFALRILKFPLWLKNKYKVFDKTRFISSNYYFLESDDSFNYFIRKGELKQSNFRIIDSFIFTQDYGYYFTNQFYSNLNKLLLSQREGTL